MNSDTLTALGALNGRRANKIHTWTGDAWETCGYDAGRLFRVATTQVSDIFSLADALMRLERYPAWYVIRGEQVRSECQYAERTYKTAQPGFRPVDRRWLCLDIDGLPAAGGDPLS